MNEKLKYPFYMLRHPFNALNELKVKKEGLKGIAIFTVLVYFLSEIFSHQITAFTFNPNEQDNINVIMIFLVSAVPIILFIVSNWCFCTLMEGEGAFWEIFIAVSFSLLPLIIINIFIAIMSNIMSLEEETFFVILNAIKNLWFYYYLFISIKIVQQYTFIRTLVSIFLTIIGMAIIVFLFVLVFSIFQQLYIFIGTIYNELSFRV